MTITISINLPLLSEFLSQKVAQMEEQGSASCVTSPLRCASLITCILLGPEFGRNLMTYNIDDDTDGFIEMIEKKFIGAWFEPNGVFCASPIYFKDDAYEFSVNPEIIKIVETNRFHGREKLKIM